MGKIILTVEGTTVGTVATGGGIVIEKEVSEQDSGRLIMAFAQIYADRFKDADGNPVRPKPADVVREWFGDVVNVATKKVLATEQENAANAALEAVNKIELI